MTATVNIQAMPTPEVWIGSTALPQQIQDEDNQYLTDENGNPIQEG